MKKVLKCDHHIHIDLVIKAGEVVEVVEEHSADSLVSHPKCKGFFAWNSQLSDVDNELLITDRIKLKSKRIRKQDDAPQAGADSSPVLQCKDEALQVSADSPHDKPSDFGDCDWCCVKDLEQDGCHKVGEDWVCSICYFGHIESQKAEV
ncbi:hypothetical protein [Vibrio diabolicus]|uniref:hypothetical protein n=1 Tax=Vibrio diabolicus TaxID=50719 RepID=UPI00215EBD7C|nr:hypothetical protein [Vibrio diabolicus]MCS0356368.1 hypothetical protein [Vibrio diabolicus]